MSVLWKESCGARTDWSAPRIFCQLRFETLTELDPGISSLCGSTETEGFTLRQILKQQEGAAPHSAGTVQRQLAACSVGGKSKRSYNYEKKVFKPLVPVHCARSGPTSSHGLVVPGERGAAKNLKLRKIRFYGTESTPRYAFATVGRYRVIILLIISQEVGRICSVLGVRNMPKGGVNVTRRNGKVVLPGEG